MRADAVAKRAALLTTARRLFSEQGPEVPLRTVAEEAGVGIGTLYRHFPTREDLIIGLGTEVSGQVQAAARRAAADWDTDPAATWRALVDELVSLRIGAFLPRLVVGHEDLVTTPAALEQRDLAIGALDAVLERARDAGLLPRDVSALRFHVGLASLTRPLPQVALLGLEDEEEWLVEIYLAGLRSRAEAARP